MDLATDSRPVRDPTESGGRCRAFTHTGDELDEANALVGRATFRLALGRATEQEKQAFAVANEAANLYRAGHRFDDCPACEAP